MSRFVKRLLIGVAVVVGLFAVATLCVNIYLQSAAVQQRIQTSAAETLGVPIEVKGALYLPWAGVVFRGIVVPGPEGAEQPIFQADGLTIQFALLPLVQQRFVVKAATLQRPVIHVRQRADGSWLVPIPSPEVLAKAPAPAEGASTGVRGPSFRVEIERLILRAGEATFVDAKGREVMRLVDANADARLTGGAAAEGTARVGEVIVARSVKPTQVGGAFTWDGSQLSLPDLTGDLAGGKIKAACVVTASGAPSFTVDASIVDAMLADLARDAGLDPGQTGGTLVGTLALRGDPRTSDSLAGQGRFELIEAQVTPLDFMQHIGEVLSIEELKLLVLNDAQMDLAIRDEKVFVESLRLQSENLILTAQGPVKFDGKLNLTAALMVNQKLQQQLKGIVGKNFVASEDPNYKQLPFSITGKLSRPRTDLLDKFLGINVGQDVGGFLQNLFGSPQKEKK